MDLVKRSHKLSITNQTENPIKSVYVRLAQVLKDALNFEELTQIISDK